MPRAPMRSRRRGPSMHKFALALLSRAALAVPALAQKKDEPKTEAAKKVAIPTNTFFKGQTASQYLAKERLIGAKVVNKDGQTVGTIDDLIVEPRRPDRGCGPGCRWLARRRREADRRAPGRAQDRHRRRQGHRHAARRHQGDAGRRRRLSAGDVGAPRFREGRAAKMHAGYASALTRPSPRRRGEGGVAARSAAKRSTVSGVVSQAHMRRQPVSPRKV